MNRLREAARAVKGSFVRVRTWDDCPAWGTPDHHSWWELVKASGHLDTLAAALDAEDAETERERVGALEEYHYCLTNAVCLFCDWESEQMVSNEDVVNACRAHVMVCEKHPLRTEVATLTRERDEALRIIGSDAECLPTCDSYGHAEGCPYADVMANFLLIKKEREEARTKVAELLDLISTDTTAWIEDKNLIATLRAEVERLTSALREIVYEAGDDCDMPDPCDCSWHIARRALEGK